MKKESQNILSNFSLEDMEKFKIFNSIMQQSQQKAVITLRVFFDEHCHIIKETRSNAYYKSVVLTSKHFMDYFGPQRAIQTIGLKEIENFVSYLQKKVIKGYPVYYRTLKAAFNKALDWGYISENYFKKIKLPKRQKVNPAYISYGQLSTILFQITIEVVRDITLTAFYTGMRLSELVNLDWKNVDLISRRITVGDEDFTTKGRNQRYIPICDELYEVFVRLSVQGSTRTIPNIHHLKKSTKAKRNVFCKSNGFKFTGDFFSKNFKRACVSAGIDKSIHFHSLRHSFASNLAQNGVSLYVIKELLGHSSITTTEIYSHLNIDSLREAMKTFDTPLMKKQSFLREITFKETVNKRMKVGG